ncbi:MAG: adenylate/guanylate cyclase [Actinomycetia bacterium]|nr:adenylate/guanylate cyclase [Actinomycetes bacterium]
MASDLDVERHIERLLDGLDGRARQGRERLLCELLEHGFSTDDLDTAVREDRLAVLLLEAVAHDGATFSASDIATASGRTLESVLRMRHLLGLPPVGADERVFDEEMQQASDVLQLALEYGLSQAAVDELLAVLGRHMWHLAADVLIIMGKEFARPNDTEYELAHRYADAAQVMVPFAAPVVVAAFQAHLRDRMHEIFVSPEEAARGQLFSVADVAVAFIDVVGFTELGERVDAGALQTLAARLLDVASTVVEVPVRVIKAIGDALLLMSRDTDALIAALVELTRVLTLDDTVPPIHVGVACGDAYVGGSDVYGHPVNLASRITDLAAPGCIWASAQVAERTSTAWAWRPAGRHRVKGLTEPVEVREVVAAIPR